MYCLGYKGVINMDSTATLVVMSIWAGFLLTSVGNIGDSKSNPNIILKTLGTILLFLGFVGEIILGVIELI